MPSESVDESDSDPEESQVIDEADEPPVTPISAPAEDVIPSAELPGPLPEPDDPIPAFSSTTPAPSPVTGDVVAGPRVSIDDNVEQRPPEIPVISVHLKQSSDGLLEASAPTMLSVELQESDALPTNQSAKSVRPSVRDTISHVAVATQSIGKVHPIELAESDGYTQTSDLIAVGYEAQAGDTLHTIAEELFAYGVLDVESPEDALLLLLQINEFPRGKTITQGEHILLPLNRHRLPDAMNSFGLTASGAWTIQVQGNKPLRLNERILIEPGEE